MKHVLFVSDEVAPNILGGAGVIATALIDGFASRGYRVSVITARPGSEYEEYNLAKARVYSFPVAKSGRVRNWFSLSNPKLESQVSSLLDKLKPDVVNVHNVANHFGFGILRVFSSYKVFFTAHDCLSFIFNKLNTPQYRSSKDVSVTVLDKLIAAKTFFIPYRSLAVRDLFKNVEKVITVSDELQRALKTNRVHSKFLTIRNGIEAPKASLVKVKAFRKKHKLENKTVVLFSGRTSIAKGFDQAVKIVERLRESKDVVLLVAGRKAPTSRFWIRYTGWLKHEEMPVVYASADLVIVPSVYLDPFPTINLEALSQGSLLATSCFGGSSESVDKNSGLVINPLDVVESASSILSLLNSKTRVSKMKKAAFARYNKFFTQKRMIDDYEKLFFN